MRNLVLGERSVVIRYSEHSKRFVYIGKKANGRVKETDSRDVVFLEEVFLETSEIKQVF